jgi:hypothetical protein
VVRKEIKDDGTERKIDGNFKPGTTLVLIDDVTTKGGSVVQAVRASAERAAAARDTSGPAWSAMCEELAAVLRGWPAREIERDVRLSSPQRVAFYELVTASLKAADTLGGACPAESALTPVGRMDAMRKRLAAVRAATAAIRPALTHFYEALDQGQ